MSIKSLCDPAGDLSIYTKSVKTESATVSGQFSVTDILAQNVVATNTITSLDTVNSDVMNSTKGYVIYDEKMFLGEGMVSADTGIVSDPTDIYYTVKLNRMNSGTPGAPVYKTSVNIEGSCRATATGAFSSCALLLTVPPLSGLTTTIRSVTGSAINEANGIYSILSPTSTAKIEFADPVTLSLVFLGQTANTDYYYTFNILLSAE